MKLIFIFFIVCIVSCTRTMPDICRINGNEDYLYSAPLSSICVPNGMILPPSNPTYEVGSPSGGVIFDKNSVNVGKKLDICPPNVAY
ncbi:outer membrane protein assembly factor BamC [Blochmannia endosymbiont of Polyrhachis (Hedomyrma) turneri]|uniref:outer membrane protein assembly factor BamC n=1 Tax=Blochmannia endosymbiont of Polyrhachis (Hedomyrma) turneri TaxID=1505596 RepID=UPI00061B2526|nr:outer membrane protein assembly factor BamC [Blochmannia endosymbiont of Polyrhachis (Hedomyrma) turneri]